ncbi:HNH endonuclease [Clostridioides difficile]|nr:HNH endonuclease [Clostridioides difficile]NJK15964.1 HNH endonuclease [Clostridioides difficile]
MNEKKCIICGEFKAGSDEHIIPKSLGNETLRIDNVCKECNEGLGKYVDEHLVNNFLTQLIRHIMGLKGQSKTIPNPFKTGKDEDGNIIHVDEQYKPYLNPSVTEENGIISISARTQKEAIKIAEKKLKRMKFSKDEIENIISNREKIPVQGYIPTVTYPVETNMRKLFLGVLKIAYEYTYYVFGDLFYNDKIAKEIRSILLDATKGIFNKEYNKMNFIQDDLKESLNKCDMKVHLLQFFKEDNELYLMISLFLEPALSFCVCVSEDASKYNINNVEHLVIYIKNNK